MWVRYVEHALGIYLATSWLWLGPPVYRTHDLVCGGLILILSLACHVRALSRTHLALLPVAGWLVGHGLWRGWGMLDPATSAQNWILVGLTLAMLAILPSHASQPPEAWSRALSSAGDASEDRRPPTR